MPSGGEGLPFALSDEDPSDDPNNGRERSEGDEVPGAGGGSESDEGADKEEAEEEEDGGFAEDPEYEHVPFQRDIYCCIARGIEFEFQEDTDDRFPMRRVEEQQERDCPPNDRFYLTVTFKWALRHLPGIDWCPIEWWELNESSTNFEFMPKDESNRPYKKSNIWSEMGNRPFQSEKPWRTPSQVANHGMPQHRARQAEKYRDDWTPRKTVKIPPGVVEDDGCMPLEKHATHAEYLFIYIRQHSGCDDGPTYEASMTVAHEPGGRPRGIPEEGTDATPKAWPVVPEGVVAPAGSGNAGGAGPPLYWKKEGEKGAAKKWHQRKSPFGDEP